MAGMRETVAEGLGERELLLKEVAYRASYRGALELDMVCRAALPHLKDMDDATLRAVRDLLLEKEGDILGWLAEGIVPPPHRAAAVGLLRGYFLAERQRRLGP